MFDEDTEEKEEGEIDVFPRQYSERFLLRFESLKFGLQLNLADEGDGNKKCNVSYGPWGQCQVCPVFRVLDL